MAGNHPLSDMVRRRQRLQMTTMVSSRQIHCITRNSSLIHDLRGVYANLSYCYLQKVPLKAQI